MNSEQRLVWAFSAAAGLAALGGIAPLALSGTSGRANAVLIPFWVAAAAFAGCALLQKQGRTVTSILYFVAGLAIVFGLLSLFSLPLRLAVLGTCPAPPAPCTSGLERPLTTDENTGIGIASALGILAIFTGFFGLVTLYRRTVVPFTSPPVRRIPPMPPASAPVPEPKRLEPVATAARHEPEEEPELPPHEEEEVPELPAHESTPPTT